MSDPQPITGDELATIKARAAHAARQGSPLPIDAWVLAREDVPRLVAEIERMRAQQTRVTDSEPNQLGDWQALVGWINRQPDTDEGVVMRALVAEIERMRSRIRQTGDS